MINGTRLGAVLVLALLALLSCDRVYGPVIYNGLPSTVTVEIGWQDGRSTRVDLYSGELIHAGIADYEIREVEISSLGRIIQMLSSEDLHRLARDLDLRRAGFVIEESGVRPMPEDELEEVISKRGREE